MKKSLFLFIAIVFCITANTFAQSPSIFKYQAATRGVDNQPIVNKNIAVRISILEGSLSGNVIFAEKHQVTTTDLGLFTVNVGAGQLISGNNLSNVDWSKGSFFIQTAIDVDGGDDFKVMGVSQLASVPFALFAQKSANVDDADADPTNEIQTLNWNENTRTLSIDNGNSVVISANDADADPQNEI